MPENYPSPVAGSNALPFYQQLQQHALPEHEQYDRGQERVNEGGDQRESGSQDAQVGLRDHEASASERAEVQTAHDQDNSQLGSDTMPGGEFQSLGPSTAHAPAHEGHHGGAVMGPPPHQQQYQQQQDHHQHTEATSPRTTAANAAAAGMYHMSAVPQGSVAFAQAGGSPGSAPPQQDKHKDKRSKVSRACDECRRKKIRCDAIDETGNVPCSNCAR